MREPVENGLLSKVVRLAGIELKGMQRTVIPFANSSEEKVLMFVSLFVTFPSLITCVVSHGSHNPHAGRVIVQGRDIRSVFKYVESWPGYMSKTRPSVDQGVE